MRRNPQTHVLTIVTNQRRRIFQRTQNAELMIATLFRYRDQGRFQLHAFVIMPDHIHVMVTPAPDHAIEKCAQLIKGGLSFAIRKSLSGEIWQNGYHAHRVTDEADLHSQITYIANNPARKNYSDYLYVHTNPAHAILIDPPPTIHSPASTA